MEGKTLADGTPLTAGNYYFGADGKMVVSTAPEVKNGVIDGFLYVNGVQQKAYQLVKLEGSFYFVSDGHKVLVNTYKTLVAKHVEGKTLADGTALTAGTYYFDADGKMIVS